jgi:hypothetical protein
MTIEVQIVNKDTRVGRFIEVAPIEIDKETGHKKEAAATRIAPGCSATFHIHLLRDLRVLEVEP